MGNGRWKPLLYIPTSGIVDGTNLVAAGIVLTSSGIFAAQLEQYKNNFYFVRFNFFEELRTIYYYIQYHCVNFICQFGFHKTTFQAVSMQFFPQEIVFVSIYSAQTL